jgi:ABC-type Mn2+/Zn2+ transport system permease subunit
MDNVFQTVYEAVQYGFIIKAVIVGSLIAVCCSFLGVFLVLKKFSLIGDGLAHVSFATVALSLLLSASPLLVSIPIVVMASFLILKLNEKADLHGDAAIGLVSSFSIATGVMISSLSGGFNVDIMSYLFGSILVISDFDVIISVILSIVVISTVFFFYNSLFAITYDEEFATVVGLNTKMLNYCIAVLTSVTIVLGIRVVGTMLISSLIVFPTVTALQVAKGFKSTILISALSSVTCVIAGVFLSFIFNFPTGATIVLMNSIFFAVAFAVKKLNLI